MAEQGITSSLENRYSNILESAKPQKDFTGLEQRDPMHIAATVLGEGAGAVGDVVGEVLSATVGWAVPNFVKDFVNEKTTGAVNSDTGKAVAKWARDNPKEWQEVKNIVNIFTVGTGGSLLTSAAKKNKGAWASGTSNYIDNYYGKNVPVSERAKGAGKWATGGVTSAVDSVLNPYSRALYAETGISRGSQQKIKDLLKNNQTSSRDLDKAMAQAIYNRHLGVQSGRKGNVSDSLIDVEKFSTVQGYRPLTVESFKSGVKATKTKLKGKTQYVSPKDAEKAYDHITKAWGITANRPTQVVFKRPSGGASGDHLQDMAFKNPVNKHIRKVIADSPKRPTTDNLYKDLLKASGKKDSGFKVLSTSAEDVKKNGLWVQSSFVGDAIVEGGVNAIYKVLPNGRVTAYMSDVHNFLEKLPVVGKQIEKALPTDVLAVSGPIHIDLMSNKWAKKAIEKQGKEYKERPKPETEKRKGEKGARDILEELSSVKPTKIRHGLENPTGLGLMSARTREE